MLLDKHGEDPLLTLMLEAKWEKEPWPGEMVDLLACK
jgi:hypothetical protein